MIQGHQGSEMDERQENRMIEQQGYLTEADNQNVKMDTNKASENAGSLENYQSSPAISIRGFAVSQFL